MQLNPSSNFGTSGLGTGWVAGGGLPPINSSFSNLAINPEFKSAHH